MHSTRTPLRALIAIVAVAVAAVATGCNPSDTPVARAGGNCTVAVVGDSLTVGARDLGRLADRFAARGCVTVGIDARPGRPSAEGASVVEAWAAGGQLPSILVVALGTNDCSRATITASAQRILAASGPDRPIVWVNTWRRGCDGQVNGALYDLQNGLNQRPDGGNLWIVDHWGWINANRWAVGRDGLHLTKAGYDAHAERIAAAVFTS